MYKDPIKVLILSHLIIFAVLSLSANLYDSKAKDRSFFWPLVFDYTKMRTEDLTDDFKLQFFKNALVMLVLLGSTFAIAFTWANSIKITDPKYTECDQKSNDRRLHSICCAWLLTDTFLSFITLAMVYFEFYVGQNDYKRKYRCRVNFAHSFALDKFAETDLYEDKAKEVNISLDDQLKERVLKWQEFKNNGMDGNGETDPDKWDLSRPKEEKKEVQEKIVRLELQRTKVEQAKLMLKTLSDPDNNEFNLQEGEENLVEKEDELQ